MRRSTNLGKDRVGFEQTITRLYKMIKYACIKGDSIFLREYYFDTSRSVTIIKRYPVGMAPAIYGTNCSKRFKDFYHVLIIDFYHRYRFKPIYHGENGSRNKTLYASMLEIIDLENNNKGLLVIDNYDNNYSKGTIIPNPMENIISPYLNSSIEKLLLNISEVDLFVGKKHSDKRIAERKHVVGISYVVKKNYERYQTVSTIILLSHGDSPQALLRIHDSRELSDALSLGTPPFMETLEIYLTMGEIDPAVVKDFIENRVYNEVVRVLVALRELGNAAR